MRPLAPRCDLELIENFDSWYTTAASNLQSQPSSSAYLRNSSSYGLMVFERQPFSAFLIGLPCCEYLLVMDSKSADPLIWLIHRLICRSSASESFATIQAEHGLIILDISTLSFSWSMSWVCAIMMSTLPCFNESM